MCVRKAICAVCFVEKSRDIGASDGTAGVVDYPDSSPMTVSKSPPKRKYQDLEDVAIFFGPSSALYACEFEEELEVYSVLGRVYIA